MSELKRPTYNELASAVENVLLYVDPDRWDDFCDLVTVDAAETLKEVSDREYWYRLANGSARAEKRKE